MIAVWLLRTVTTAGAGVAICIGIIGGLVMAMLMWAYNPWSDATLAPLSKLAIWMLRALTIVGAVVGPLAAVALSVLAFALPARPRSAAQCARARRITWGLFCCVVALGAVWWLPIGQFAQLAWIAFRSVDLWLPAGPGDWWFRRQIGAIALGLLFPSSCALVLYLRFVWLPRISRKVQVS